MAEAAIPLWWTNSTGSPARSSRRLREIIDSLERKGGAAYPDFGGDARYHGRNVSVDALGLRSSEWHSAHAPKTRTPWPGLSVSAFADSIRHAAANVMTVTAKRLIDSLRHQPENKYLASAAIPKTSKMMIKIEITPIPQPIPPIIFIMLSIMRVLHDQGCCGEGASAGDRIAMPLTKA